MGRIRESAEAGRGRDTHYLSPLSLSSLTPGSLPPDMVGLYSWHGDPTVVSLLWPLGPAGHLLPGAGMV